MDRGFFMGNGEESDKDKDSSLQKAENPPNWGIIDGLADLNTTLNGVGVNAEGHIVLDRSSSNVAHYMWLADDSGSMVSKFNVETGKEEARYRSLINIQCKEDQTPDDNNCTPFEIRGTYHAPSRTAIDADGNAWVGNRGFGGLNSVTKIAGDKSFCVDRNGNGHIETSADLDGSGAIEPEEVLPLGNDECLLFTTPVCGGYAGARALAIDDAGDAWVGCFSDQTAYQLDSQNGRIKRGPIPLGMSPYGAIVDGRQNVWFVYGGQLQGVNTQTGEVLSKNAAGAPTPVANSSGCSAYSLAVDAQSRVWLSYGCFYNHYAAETESKWQRCNLNGIGGLGIAVDAKNNVYTSTGAALTSFHWDDKTNTCTPNTINRTGTGAENRVEVGVYGIGVGFDTKGNPWTVRGTQAARLDLKTGEVFRTTPARGHSPSYYTYSDFTGFQHRNFTARRGVYRRIIEGCALYSAWKTLSWEAELPEGTQLIVSVRVANTREELSSAKRHLLEASPADLSEIPKSSFMQVEFILESDAKRQSSPILRGYAVEWACEQPIG